MTRWLFALAALSAGCASSRLPPPGHPVHPEPVAALAAAPVEPAPEACIDPTLLEPDRTCSRETLASAVASGCAFRAALGSGDVTEIAALAKGELAITYVSPSGMAQWTVAPADLATDVARFGRLPTYLRVADDAVVRVLGCDEHDVYWLVLGDPYRRATVRFEPTAIGHRWTGFIAMTP